MGKNDVPSICFVPVCLIYIGVTLGSQIYMDILYKQAPISLNMKVNSQESQTDQVITDWDTMPLISL